MVFVYDFFPGSETLMSRHFSHPNQQLALMDPFNGEGNRPYSQSKNSLLRQQAAIANSAGGGGGFGYYFLLPLPPLLVTCSAQACCRSR
jgi:hypothetical protein